MKKNILIIIVAFLSSDIYSQSDSLNSWSMTIKGGMIATIPAGSGINNLGNAGFDISYNYNKTIAIYLEGVYDFNNGFLDNIIEISIGSRIFAGNRNKKLFFETSIGYYNQWFQNQSALSIDGIIIKLGPGIEQRIYKNISFILKGNVIITDFLTDFSQTYIGVYPGIKLNF